MVVTSLADHTIVATFASAVQLATPYVILLVKPLVIPSPSVIPLAIPSVVPSVIQLATPSVIPLVAANTSASIAFMGSFATEVVAEKANRSSIVEEVVAISIQAMVKKNRSGCLLDSIRCHLDFA